MRILLTNDDGLHAVGIRALHTALAAQGRHEIFAVAPATVQSACSHTLTFDRMLPVRREQLPGGLQGVAVEGSPADCVKLGVHCLWPEHFGPGTRPDLVVSGINMGSNSGINHHYSGTVAAAREGSILSIPSLAFSLTLSEGTPLWSTAARWSLEVLDRALDGPLQARTLLSFNLPVAEEDRPTPSVVVCRMNDHPCEDSYERRWDPRGGEYYWPSGYGPTHVQVDPGTDVEAVDAGNISMTPLGLDGTDGAQVERWRGVLDGEPD